MRIAVFAVVVDVRRRDVIFHGFEGFGHAAHHVGVTEIKADSYVFKMRRADELYQLFWGGEFIRNVL